MKFRPEAARAPDGMNMLCSAAETLKRLEAKGCERTPYTTGRHSVRLFPTQREKGFFSMEVQLWKKHGSR